LPAKKAHITNMANEVVPRLFYEEKEQECIAKEEQIQVFILLDFTFKCFL
jgi:hypothetical protein